MGGSGSSKLTVTTPSDREIVLTRVFDAPRDLVFEAHSWCEHLSHWWGPRKYELAGCEVDFRPGGAWRTVHPGSRGRGGPGLPRRVRRDRPPGADRVDLRVGGHAGPRLDRDPVRRGLVVQPGSAGIVDTCTAGRC